MEEKIRLLLVDDYPVVLSGLVSMFKNHDDIEVVGMARNGKKAIDLASKCNPDVVLMNINMPEVDGITATREIKKANPSTRVLIFSGINTADKVLQVLSAGAIGFVLKDAAEPELLQAIHAVANGEAWLHPSVIGYMLKQMNTAEENEGSLEKLTDREFDVLRYMTKGYSNQEIAEKMVISMTTVHSHVSKILAKLEVSSRTQAVIYAMKAGLVPSDNDKE